MGENTVEADEPTPRGLQRAIESGAVPGAPSLTWAAPMLTESRSGHAPRHSLRLAEDPRHASR